MKFHIVLILLVLALNGCSEGGTGGTGGMQPPAPVNISISGQANKGPFAEGATVTVTELSSTGAAGDSQSASTMATGQYELTVEEDTINLIEVEGNYFSEITGTLSDEPIAISGVFAGSENDAANVNVLTHLIHDRVIALLSNGNTATAAIDMAEDELTLAMSTVIPTPDADVRFSDLVVLNALQDEPTEEGNGYLLALSSIFEQHAMIRAEENDTNPRTELADLLQAFADDLADDGMIDLGENEQALRVAQQRLNPNTIHQHLFEFDAKFKERVVADAATTESSEDLECSVNLDRLQCFSSAAQNTAAAREAVVAVSLNSIVADMNLFIDSDGDGVVNSQDADDDGDGIEDETDSRPFDATLLVPARSSAQFASYLKAGLRQWFGVNDNIRTRQISASPFEGNVAIPAAESLDSQEVVNRVSAVSADAAGFTTTNVLVAGVDEIDPVKYDGEHMYVANNDNIQILRTSTDGSAADLVSRININSGKEDQFNTIRGMYLTDDGNTVVSVSGEQYFSWFREWFAPWNWNGTTRIDLVNVTNRSDPALFESLELDGSYINSRRIGDVLYVITRFTPEVEELHSPPQTDEDKEENERLIEAVATDDLLPTVTYRDGSTVSLVASDNCFLPPTTDTKREVQYPTLTTITAINLNNPADLTSVCLTDGIQGMHMSLNAIYLAALDNGRPGIGFYNNTIIHKFSVAQGAPAYVGSGVVDGTFWGDPTFLMGEHEGNLTVVTTRNTKGERQFEHVLNILGESETNEFQLAQLGQIPNDTSEGTIGKPGEQIFASRIFGDRAYIVTFQQVDPVYVIDLADPRAPTILGELEIPGFSTYLHPLSNDLLLGVGRDSSTDDQPVLKGINVRLFDVSDPTRLSVLSDISIGRRGTETAVAWNPHAFTLLSQGDSHRFTIPVRVHGAHVNENPEQQPWQYYPWTHEALYLFEVNEVEKVVVQSGLVIANDFDTGYRFAPNCCTWDERSFLNGEVIHYLRNNRLYTALWDTPENTSEAFIPTVFDADEPTFCTEELRNGLNVAVADRITGERLNCPAVTAREGEFMTNVYQGCDENGDQPQTLIAEGLYERAGTYEITVTNEGYQDWTGTDVVIQADQCHVHPTFLGVFLNPEEEE